MQSNWTGSQQPLHPMNVTADTALYILMDRQSQIGSQLDRIEGKIDQIPECKAANVMAEQLSLAATQKSGGFQVVGVQFKNWQTAVALLIILAIASGHVTFGQVARALLGTL